MTADRAASPAPRRASVLPFFRLGKRVGDAFTDLYFRLPREKQESWDRERVAHHGAVGYLAAAGAIAGLASAKGPRSRRVLDATLAFSLGLAESDAHDREWWWTEGRWFEAARTADSRTASDDA